VPFIANPGEPLIIWLTRVAARFAGCSLVSHALHPRSALECTDLGLVLGLDPTVVSPGAISITATPIAYSCRDRIGHTDSRVPKSGGSAQRSRGVSASLANAAAPVVSDHQRVDVDHAVLNQVQREHADLVVFPAVAGPLATTGVELHLNRDLLQLKLEHRIFLPKQAGVPRGPVARGAAPPADTLRDNPSRRHRPVHTQKEHIETTELGLKRSVRYGHPQIDSSLSNLSGGSTLVIIEIDFWFRLHVSLVVLLHIVVGNQHARSVELAVFFWFFSGIEFSGFRSVSDR
jgi:hypothetical protein